MRIKRVWGRDYVSAVTVALAAVLGPGAARVAAQTRFAWPDTVVQLEQYTTLEECMVAVERATPSARLHQMITSKIWDDTLPHDPQARTRPLLEGIVTTARRCLARLPGATVPLEDYHYFLPLYLKANRETDFDTLVARRLALVPPLASLVPLPEAKSAADSARTRARTGVLETLLSAYQSAWPLRQGSKVERLVEENIWLTEPVELHPYKKVMHRLEVAQQTGDSAAVATLWPLIGTTIENFLNAVATDTISAGLRQVLSGVPDSLRRRVEASLMADLYERAHQAELDDSLRHSTASWWAARRALRARLVDSAFAAAREFPIDRLAPIAGDFWFRRNDSTSARPTRGKVSLVFVVQEAGYSATCATYPTNTQEDRSGWQCQPEFAMLRRLAKRFPALEVTLVAQTKGYFVYNPVNDPAKEAELIRHWLHDIAHVPGALAVQKTPITQLPAPDGRLLRTIRPAVTLEAKPGQASPAVGVHGGAILVDREGTIMERSGLQRSEEQEFAHLISILLQQR